MNKRINRNIPSFEKVAKKTLTGRELLLIKLFYFEGISREQIAKALKIGIQEASKIHGTAVSKIKNCRREFVEEYHYQEAS